MNISEATKTIQLILFDRYGTFLTLKEVGVIRKTEGKKWGGKVYLEAKTLSEPIFIGIIEIDEDKKLTGIFSKHEIISKIVEVHNQPQDYEEDPFADLFSEEEVEEEMDPDEIREELDELVKKADEKSLQKSRSIYPLLLNHTDNRGPILHEMGLLEIALKNNDLALEYLEAAAIEYANLAQVELIFKIADRVESLVGAKAFEEHRIYKIMKDTVEKMTSISSLGEAKVLAGLPEPTIFRLSSSSRIVKLEKGETIIREGEPAEKVIIIKSGLLNVSLQGFGNEQKIVRTCFPGDFLGENSVLHPPGSKLTTASLICASDTTEVWQINANNLINLMKQESILNQRITNIKELHQLDSFFSMHENMKDLDVNTRDELLSCIKTFIVATPGDVILDAGEVPENVFLVVKGEVEYRLPDDSKIVFGTDHFIGMRDALHGIALEGEYVVTKESNLAMFDSEKLREMALASSTATVSILERLN